MCRSASAQENMDVHSNVRWILPEFPTWNSNLNDGSIALFHVRSCFSPPEFRGQWIAALIPAQQLYLFARSNVNFHGISCPACPPLPFWLSLLATCWRSKPCFNPVCFNPVLILPEKNQFVWWAKVFMALLAATFKRWDEKLAVR